MRTMMFILLMLISFPLYADPITLAVVKVKDGDTIAISVLLPPPLNELSVRVLGIDTPEKPAASYATTGKLNRAKCVAEAELALKATEFVRDQIRSNRGLITLNNYSWDKYGGRINADVFIGTILLADLLMNEGYAVPYSGSGPRHNWCQ